CWVCASTTTSRGSSPSGRPCFAGSRPRRCSTATETTPSACFTTSFASAAACSRSRPSIGSARAASRRPASSRTSGRISPRSSGSGWPGGEPTDHHRPPRAAGRPVEAVGSGRSDHLPPGHGNTVSPDSPRPGGSPSRPGCDPWAWALVGLLGLLLALYLVFPRLDADQAITGLMGVYVLRGEFPIFFWMQDHAGVPESYVAAPLFFLFGISRRVLD